jgi:hypothetical protein
MPLVDSFFRNSRNDCRILRMAKSYLVLHIGAMKIKSI